MPPPPLPSLQSIALFLDFDGTLVEIAERPEAVQLSASTREVLAQLEIKLGGALAIVTGRDITAIDNFLMPLRLPIAGIHGTTRRDFAGCIHNPPSNDGFLCSAERHLTAFAAHKTGLLIECKTASIALHYRKRPDLEADCITAMENVAAGFAGIEIKRGKLVVEAKPDGANKGSAVAEFMSEAPFAGRLPVFAGDDITDEDAFRLVNAEGGISIKIGYGATVATYSVRCTSEFLHWLENLSRAARTLEGQVERS